MLPQTKWNKRKTNYIGEIMKTAKQKAIELAYGEYWEKVKDFVDENGWCYLNISQKEPINHFAIHFIF